MFDYIVIFTPHKTAFTDVVYVANNRKYCEMFINNNIDSKARGKGDYAIYKIVKTYQN